MNNADKPRKVTRLVALDMDNTILDGRFIDTAAAYLGKTEALWSIRNTVNDPSERAGRIAALLKDVPLTTLRDILAGIPIVHDVKPVVTQLKAWGCIVGIISDSYDYVTEILREFLDLDFALANQLEHDGTVASGTVVIPDHFRKSGAPLCEHDICKSYAIDTLSKKYAVTQEYIIAMGDSEGDICMVRNAGTGIAFCSEDSRLTAAAKHVIVVRSFEELLHIVGKDMGIQTEAGR